MHSCFNSSYLEDKIFFFFFFFSRHILIETYKHFFLILFFFSILCWKEKWNYILAIHSHWERKETLFIFLHYISSFPTWSQIFNWRKSTKINHIFTSLLWAIFKHLSKCCFSHALPVCYAYSVRTLHIYQSAYSIFSSLTSSLNTVVISQLYKSTLWYAFAIRLCSTVCNKSFFI